MNGQMAGRRGPPMGVEPALLLRSLHAVEARYARDADAPSEGDAVLDRLVEFLRQAMVPLRAGCSTLRAELALLERYARLREAVDGTVLRLECEAPPRDAAFVPLLLPALLDQVLDSARGARITLQCRRRDATLRVCSRARCARWTADFDARLKTSLQALFDSHWRLRLAPSAGVALELDFPWVPSGPTVSDRLARQGAC